MMLAAHALDIGHGARPLGRGLELEVSRGEVACLLGPNGAGKTTLLRTLLGLLRPLGGRVTLDGHDMATLSRAEIARGVAYVPQASASAFDFTLAEVVEMGRTAHLGAFASAGRHDREVARAALDRMGISALADRLLGAVSGGERQLALIARALASEAGTIVMDEPTANLDFANQARVLAEIARLKAAGVGVLFSTHSPSQALQIADTALLLREGHTLARGPTAQTLTEPLLSALYGIEVERSERGFYPSTRAISKPS